MRKDEFADLNFGNPIKQSKKNDDFDFGFADFNQKKKKKNNDFDFGFGQSKQTKDPLQINSRLGQKGQKQQGGLLQFKGQEKKKTKYVDLLDFDLPQGRPAPKSQSQDYDFL